MTDPPLAMVRVPLAEVLEAVPVEQRAARFDEEFAVLVERDFGSACARAGAEHVRHDRQAGARVEAEEVAAGLEVGPVEREAPDEVELGPGDEDAGGGGRGHAGVTATGARV